MKYPFAPYMLMLVVLKTKQIFRKIICYVTWCMNPGQCAVFYLLLFMYWNLLALYYKLVFLIKKNKNNNNFQICLIYSL